MLRKNKGDEERIERSSTVKRKGNEDKPGKRKETEGIEKEIRHMEKERI